MILVVDSSAVLFELASPDGLDPVAAANDLVAPALLWSEVASVIHETAYRGEISAELVALMFERLGKARISRRHGTDLYAGARDVATEYGWAKTYDAEFVALARLLGSPLFTRDARLARRIDASVEVRGPDEVARSSGS